MAKTLVKLICYVELDHKDGLDPRTVNLKVRELLADDWITLITGRNLKSSYIRTLSKTFGSEFKAKIYPESLLASRLSNLADGKE